MNKAVTKIPKQAINKTYGKKSRKKYTLKWKKEKKEKRTKKNKGHDKVNDTDRQL